MPRGGRGGVEGDSDVGGVLLFKDEEQRVDEAVERGGVDTLRVADRILDQREVGAVNEGHAVEQEKAFHGVSLAGLSSRVQRLRADDSSRVCRFNIQHQRNMHGRQLAH